MEDTPQMKRCSGCKEVKPASEFGALKKAPDGLRHHCKECRNLKWRLDNPRAKPKPPKPPIGFKRCSKCGEERLLAEYHRNRSSKDGLNDRCKICLRSAARFEAQLEAEKLASQGLKQCTRCSTVKPATSEFFPVHLERKDGFNSWCRSCYTEKSKEYVETRPEEVREKRRQDRLDNPEKYKAKRKEKYWNDPQKAKDDARQWRLDNPERSKENSRRWEKRNPEKRRQASNDYYKRHPDRALQSGKQWRAKNPDKSRTYAHNRRAREKGLPGTLTTKQWYQCLEYWDNRCAVCGHKAGLWCIIAQEHWIAVDDPRPNNPGNAPWNLLPMCHSKVAGWYGCNNVKWKKDPIEWLFERFDHQTAIKTLKRIEAYFEWVKASR